MSKDDPWMITLQILAFCSPARIKSARPFQVTRVESSTLKSSRAVPSKISSTWQQIESPPLFSNVKDFQIWALPINVE